MGAGGARRPLSFVRDAAFIPHLPTACRTPILARPMQTLTIATRFRGPPESSNGGYFAGLVATLASRTVSVRLLKPPPLNIGLEVNALDDGGLRVLRGEEPIGEAHPAFLALT